MCRGGGMRRVCGMTGAIFAEASLLGVLAADFTNLAAALATLADAFFRSPRRASFFREPGFAAPDFVLGLGFATWMDEGTYPGGLPLSTVNPSKN